MSTKPYTFAMPGSSLPDLMPMATPVTAKRRDQASQDYSEGLSASIAGILSMAWCYLTCQTTTRCALNTAL
ncbi:hypothetical protein U6Q53_12450, partial [Cutibacterium acnes]